MLEDCEVIKSVLSGGRNEYAKLVVKYRTMAMRLAYRLTKDIELAEDIVQESFFKAYQKLDKFEGRASFKSWFYQITLNTGRNRLRKRRANHIEVSKVSLATPSQAEDGFDNFELTRQMEKEVSHLPGRQQTALRLRIFKDLSFKEIAMIMKCPYDTAKANYRHALIKLKSRFEGDDNLQQLKKIMVKKSGANGLFYKEIK